MELKGAHLVRMRTLILLFVLLRTPPTQAHSRPQSPSFLGRVVGKRGAATGATGRLQIKPSGSGDENDKG